jgi:hypothetical protein
VTYYEVLGADRRASPAELRAAFRRAARAAHPDHAGDASGARMAAVNEAWRVLGDAELRRRYDAELAARERPSSGDAWARAAPSSGATSPSAAPRVAPQPVVHQPARFPWRFMAALLTLGVALVVAGVVLYDPPAPAKPDGILRPGDCVALSAELEASEVPCGQHDAIVDRLVPFGEACPSGTQGYRDRQGMGTACVVTSAPRSS